MNSIKLFNSKKIFAIGVTAAFIVGGFFVYSAFALPAPTVTITPGALDVNQMAENVVFNVIKAGGTNNLISIAIDYSTTGISDPNPADITCPSQFPEKNIDTINKIISCAMGDTGSTISSGDVTWQNFSSASAGDKTFVVTTLNTMAQSLANSAVLSVKTLSATATVLPATINTDQAAAYTFSVTNTGEDAITEINGTMAGFVVNSYSATGWISGATSGDSFSLTGGSLAPGNTLDISVNATAPAVNGTQAVSLDITGFLGGTASVTPNPDSVAVQTPAVLLADAIMSSEEFISKNPGAINATTIFLPVTNDGEAAANITSRSLVLRDSSDADISDQFTITPTDAVSQIAGGETETLTWSVTANGDADENLVSAVATLNYNDTNDSTGRTERRQSGADIFTVDNTLPIFTDLSVDTELAKTGDVVEITFAASEILAENPVVVVDGSAANYDSNIGNDYIYLFTVPAITTHDILDATILINGVDQAGNQGIKSDNTLLDIDTQNPTFESIVVENSNAPNPAKVGSVVTITFDASEVLDGDPTVTVGGQNANKDFASSGQHYVYTRSLDGAETEGTAKILISGIDIAGNEGSDNFASVATDFSAPTFSIVYYFDEALTTPFTNNYMKEGTYYIEIHASEALGLAAPTISIAAEGTANDVDDAVTVVVSGNDYKYARIVVSDAAAVGLVAESITISGTDLSGNATTNGDVSGEKYTDTVVPSTTINSPDSSSWHNANFNVSVSDSDAGSGVATAEYRILSDLNNDGTIAETEVTVDWTARTPNNSVSISVGDGFDCRNEGVDSCKIWVRAIDVAGNSNWKLGSYEIRKFSIDWTAPDAATISIAGGAIVTKDATPVLTLTAGVVASDYMSFSCNGVDWSDWTAWATSYEGFDMTSGNRCTNSDGQKTVYVRVEDAHGNIQTTINSDSVIYDSNNTLTVGSSESDDFAVIQEAIINATAGDTIEVAAGTYTENVIITKSLTLKGINVDVPAGRIPGSRVAESIVNGGILINTNNRVEINGFTVQNGAELYGAGSIGGITIAGSGHVIKNNIFIGDSRSGLYPAIHHSSGDNLVIDNNEMHNWTQGVYLNPSNGHIVENNNFHNNVVGIGSDGLSNVEVNENIFQNNTAEGWGASAVGSNVRGHQNKFINTGKGIAQYSGNQIDGTNNWWGAAVPNFAAVTSGNVDYDPWYMDEEMIILSSSVGKATIYVDDDYTSDGTNDEHYWGYNAFATIQEGTNAVDVGGTVNVAAGTYNESVLVNKDLDFVGVGATKPVISGVAGTNYIFKVENADGVVVDNFEINGGGSGTGDNGFDYGILVNNSGDSVSPVEIKNSVVKNIWKNGSNGIGAENGSYVLSHDNTISSFHKRGIRFINSQGKFYNNEVIGDNVDGTTRVQNLVNLWGGSNVEIYGNTLHNALSLPGTPTWDSPGVFVSSYGGSGASYANVHDNEIYNCDSGIIIGSVYADADASTADITDNNLHNLNWAINFEKNTASAVIHGNKFVDVNKAVNAEADGGLLSDPPAVNAKLNWWGSENGPAAGMVYNAVDYRPWCTTKDCLTFDTDVPDVTISSVASPLTNVSPIPIIVTFDEAVTDFDENDVTVGNGILRAFDGSGTIYTFDVTPTTDGSVTVDIAANVAWDASGNYNTEATQFSIEYDTAAPTATLSKVPSSPTKETAADITVGGDGVVTYKFKLDEGVYSEFVSVSEHIILTDLFDDEHMLSVIGKDTAGNEQSLATEHVWTVDTAAPAVTVDSLLTNNTTPTITGTVSDADAAVSVEVNGNTYEAVVVGGENPTWSANVTDSLEAGTYNIIATATDAAGNPATDETMDALIIELTAPLLDSHTPSVNAVGISPLTNITLNFNEAVIVEDGDVTISGGVAKTIAGSETATITIDPATTLADNTTYTITLDGITDLAGNPLGTYSWSFTTSVSYSIALNFGWNLISLPVVPNDTDIADVLGSNAANIISVYTYDAATDVWRVYHPNSPSTSDLQTMTAGYAYWINYGGSVSGTLAGSGNLLLEGNNTPPSRKLSAGWNLIGYYQRENTTSVSADSALANSLNNYWTLLAKYNNQSSSFSFLTSSSQLNPGEGFWIFLNGVGGTEYNYTIGNIPS